MREFHSYEGINPKIHYYVPRETLIEQAYQSLHGKEPDDGGHYITVWGPRQSGKSWVMRQTVRRFKAQNSAETEHPFEVAILSMQSARPESPPTDVLELLVTQLKIGFKRDFPMISDWREVAGLFTAEYFNKPVILILDEFDGMGTEHINHFSTEFRHIYISRRNEVDHPTGQKSYLLHGLALIGVRSVLGIENNSGSPFNVQRSLPIPNLTFEEVDSMFHWYERESDQTVEQAVIDRIFYETQGQPGLVGWLGEVLTSETYNQDRTKPITMDHFETVYAAATYDLPNNNILNLISKAKQEPYRDLVLTLFNTEADIEFSYDDIIINFLYMNGVVERRITADRRRYVKFSSPFAQKRLFNYFARNLFPQAGQLYVPFTDLSPVITDDSLNVKNLLRLYESYLQKNRGWLLADAPVRKDLRIHEAVFHFNLYSYLRAFFQHWKGHVYPEFPTGNGQIDLLITYAGKRYGVEVKSFQDERSHKEGVAQAIRYGKRLELKEVVLVSFIEQVSDEIRQQYEAPQVDEKTGIRILPVFVTTSA